VGDADVGELMRGVTWIDLPEPRFDAETALAVLRAFYPGEKRPNPATARDVYVSCSWRPGDAGSARTVCRSLIAKGFRLIGDARDQKGFAGGDRVERIIVSCGAFVGVVPYRGVEQASAGEKPYKYFLREMDYATQHGIPCIVVADPRVRRADGSDAGWNRMDTDAAKCTDAVEGALEGLWEDWRPPPKPQYVFCALDLDSESSRATGPIRHLIERVTGMPTVVGNEIYEEPLQSAIMRKVCNAFLVLADLTDDNVNACIEAGMALAVGGNVELVARGQPRRPPFMLRSLQMSTYTDQVEQIGIVHRIARPYRRRIINTEL
jgi:hypothetical protein